MPVVIAQKANLQKLRLIIATENSGLSDEYINLTNGLVSLIQVFTKKQ
jgi:hypothetical protein